MMNDEWEKKVLWFCWKLAQLYFKINKCAQLSSSLIFLKIRGKKSDSCLNFGNFCLKILTLRGLFHEKKTQRISLKKVFYMELHYKFYKGLTFSRFQNLRIHIGFLKFSEDLLPTINGKSNNWTPSEILRISLRRIKLFEAKKRR